MIRIPLERIDDNPYQTRMTYGNLADLTASVQALHPQLPATAGIIQVPLARLILDGQALDPAAWPGEAAAAAIVRDQPAARVELALGHRRKRVFVNLAATDEAYATFPVTLMPLDDQAMADIAWAENEKRQDISAVERAVAIDRAQQAFGWTQTQVGARWGLSQSAVANLLRLLRLPDKIQALIRDGELTGRHGRALLPLVDLNVRWDVYLDAVRPEGDHRPGVAAVVAFVENYLENETYPLSEAPWDADWAPAAVEGTQACTGCPRQVQVGRDARCTHLPCYHAKQRAYKYQVKGPALASRTYNQLRSHGWQALSPTGWARCAGCGRTPRDFSTPQDWLRSHLTFLCPECVTHAQLQPTPAAETATSQETPTATVVARGHLEAAAPTEVDAPADNNPTPIRPAPTVPAPAPTTIPQPKPAPPPATILTARIFPGDSLAARRVIVNIGEEGRGPRAFRNGTLDELDALVSDILQETFGAVPTASDTGPLDDVVYPVGTWVCWEGYAGPEYGRVKSYTGDLTQAFVETDDDIIQKPRDVLQEAQRELAPA